MRRILLMLASVAVLALPAAAAARAHGGAKPGFVVVRNAATDGPVNGAAVVTLAVDGFVLGKVSQEGSVAIYHLAATAGGGSPSATGVDLSRRSVEWHGVPGAEYSGSGFRFRGVGGVYRVVIRGSGVSLYAAGRGRITLHGSVHYPNNDGTYSFNGQPFRSMPSGRLTRRIGG
jgi:hypothetical protein